MVWVGGGSYFSHSQNETKGSRLRRTSLLMEKLEDSSIFFLFLFVLNLVAPCSTWDLRILTRGQTHTLCFGSVESQPQAHQGSRSLGFK